MRGYVLLGLLAVTLTTVSGQVSLLFKPQPCCTPKQYEVKAWATVGQKNGPIASAMVPRLSMDLTKNMTSLKEEVNGQQLEMIVAYNTRTIYVIVHDDDNELKCHKMKYPAGREASACIPNDAEYLGQMTLGAGKSALKCDSWAIKARLRDPPAEMTEVLVMQSDGCVPVNEYVYVRSGEYEMEQTMGFYDFTRGIKDPSVFDIPTICDHAEELDMGVLGGVSKALASKFLA